MYQKNVRPTVPPHGLLTYLFFLIEPSRRTPHLCGIVLTLGSVMGHTPLSLPLLTWARIISNRYHDSTPPLFLLRQRAHQVDIALILLNFCDSPPITYQFFQCRKVIPLTPTGRAQIIAKIRYSADNLIYEHKITLKLYGTVARLIYFLV